MASSRGLKESSPATERKSKKIWVSRRAWGSGASIHFRKVESHSFRGMRQRVAMYPPLHSGMPARMSPPTTASARAWK